MALFHLTVITPTGIYLEDEVEELYLKTSVGYVGILARHTPMIAKVDVCAGFIKFEGEKHNYAIFGGILSIKKEGVQLIVNNIERHDKIDIERAKKSKQRASERIKSKSTNNIDLKRAEASLARALARIKASEGNII